MNWEMLSAIGQVVAATGVIPSLIYLAVQIREQNKERRRAGINTLTAQWSDLVKSAQESREFAALFLQGVRSFHGLDAPDKLRFSAFFTRFTRNCEGMSGEGPMGRSRTNHERLFRLPRSKRMVGDPETLVN